eukprot:scaffold2053_cov112-Cylindrotheca_fusiformis.AAC.9
MPSQPPTRMIALVNASKSHSWILILLIICVFQQQCATGETSAETLRILAHPAMFGKRWPGVVTVVLREVDIDLCHETIANSTSNFVGATDGQYDTAMLYDDPYAKTREKMCSYAQMAQAAEKFYPMARYLLVSRVDGLVAMRKDKKSPDTNLGLASVTIEDVEAIRNMIPDGGQNRTSLTTAGIVVSVDAVSRSFVDCCDCEDRCEHSEHDFKRWMVFLRVGSGLSLIGSTYVFLSLIGTRKRRSESMGILFNRLLLGICISDAFSSIAMLLGSWPMQSSPPGDYEGSISQAWWDKTYPGAAGNDATCTLQGFFVHVGVAGSTFFTGFIALQTLLWVRYSWNDQQMHKAEIAFYTVGISIPLVTAIWAAVDGKMGNLPIGICWINMTPQKCEDEMGGALIDEYCDDVARGDDSFAFQIGLAMVWVLLTLVVTFYSMISLFCFVRKLENRSAQWSLTSRHGQLQKKVLLRAMMYISVYVVIWIPTMATLTGASLAELTTVACLLPLQGFLNAVIYSGVVDKCFLRKSPEPRNTTVSSNELGERSQLDLVVKTETRLGEREAANGTGH